MEYAFRWSREYLQQVIDAWLGLYTPGGAVNETVHGLMELASLTFNETTTHVEKNGRLDAQPGLENIPR